MTKRTTGDDASPDLPVPAGGDPASMDEWAARLVDQARAEGVELTGDGGLLTDLMRQVLQRGLEVELAEHLGYEPHAVEGRGSGNSRNGSYPKTMTTEIGEVEVRVPRDRAGRSSRSRSPSVSAVSTGSTGNVISLYAKGMTTGDIQAHLAEIYGTEISRETISKITDAIVEDMVAWQNRPLDRVYPVMLIDAIVIKVRDRRSPTGRSTWRSASTWTANATCWACWVGPSGGEGAKQWMTMLTELRNRGVADALIVCCDGLKGLPESIRATWPQATVQTCVVHLVRNTLRYAPRSTGRQIAAGEMREIYTAPTVEAAEPALRRVRRQWGDRTRR